MPKDLIRISENWPEAWRNEYISVMAETPLGARQSHIYNAARRHAEFCKNHSHPVLTCQSIFEHGHDLRCELSKEIAGAYVFVLVRIARIGADKALRDELYENFRDRRTARELLEASYVPRQIRAIGLRALERQEVTRNDLAAFDLYLRVVDRVGTLPSSPSAICVAFWRQPPSSRQQCAQLGRAATLIDLMLPGNMDANALRIAQRALRSKSERPGNRQCIHTEIDGLVDSARQVKGPARGRRYSKKKRAEQRGVLMRFKAVLEASGRSFALDREAINIFASHAFKQFRSQRDGEEGWSAIYAARTFETLATFVSDDALRKDLLQDASDYHVEAKKEPKAKELTLSKCPTTLPALFKMVGSLLIDAEKVPFKSRPQLLNTAAALALLCVYPLRRADIVGLRFGYELIRVLEGWCLASLPTQKNGKRTEPIRLPSEITAAIDAALLQGTSGRFLWNVYTARRGQCLWSDWKTGRQHSEGLLTQCLSDHVDYSPHIFRTLWADHLIAHGANRQLVSVVLQHKHLMSQKEYEVLASKLRLLQAVKALADIADDASQNGAA